MYYMSRAAQSLRQFRPRPKAPQFFYYLKLPFIKTPYLIIKNPTINDQKLRVYQNKLLPHDRRCREFNTFPTRNQTPNSKNQDFLSSI